MNGAGRTPARRRAAARGTARLTGVLAVAALGLVGCAAGTDDAATVTEGPAATEADVTGDAGAGAGADGPGSLEPAPELIHVHAVVPDAAGGALVAAHTGVFRVNADGTVDGPLGGADFDAMGFAVSGDTMYASGHPGPSTAAELGAPNLGLIASEDGGASWQPVAFTGVEDFHAFTTAPDGAIHGVRSTDGALTTSTDGGATWTDGAQLAAIDLAVGPGGELFAATADGVAVSRDGGATFAVDTGVPPLYRIERLADGSVAGVAEDGAIHVRDARGAWTRTGAVDAPVEALGAGTDGGLLVVDERGLARVSLAGERTEVHPLDR